MKRPVRGEGAIVPIARAPWQEKVRRGSVPTAAESAHARKVISATGQPPASNSATGARQRAKASPIRHGGHARQKRQRRLGGIEHPYRRGIAVSPRSRRRQGPARHRSGQSRRLGLRNAVTLRLPGLQGHGPERLPPVLRPSGTAVGPLEGQPTAPALPASARSL